MSKKKTETTKPVKLGEPKKTKNSLQNLKSSGSETISLKVLNLDNVPDSAGEVFDFDKLTFETSWVPVVINFGDSMLDFVAYGKLERRYQSLWVEFETSRKDLGALVPAVGGKVVDKYKNSTGGFTIVGHVYKIGLCTYPNTDKRIKSVENQTK